MSGFIDSVNRVFLLEHRHGAMHCSGAKNYHEALEICARKALAMLNAKDAAQAMKLLQDRLNRVFADRLADDAHDVTTDSEA